MKKNKQVKYLIILILMMIMLSCKNKKSIALNPGEGGTASQIYENAQKSIRRNPEKARLLFKEIMQLYPNSVYAQRSKIGIADSYFKTGDESSLIIAAAEYQEYVNLYPNSPDAVYAKYQIGMCYYKQKRQPGRDQGNTKLTIKHFESMVKQYPDTPEAEEAKKKIAKARQDLASHYFSIGLSNYRLRAYNGAIIRFKEIIDSYPEFSKNDRLFYYTGLCYIAKNDWDSALSFFQNIINNYPRSKYVAKAKKLLKKMPAKKIDKK